MKAAYQSVTDAQSRKRGEQIGLDILVVHAVNDENLMQEIFCVEANALSSPPGYYVRKNKT